MASYYILRVSRSDVTVPGKSKAPDLYMRVSYENKSCSTKSINELPPHWNEAFPITCSSHDTRFTFDLMKEGLKDSRIGSKDCSLDEILREDGEDICVSLQSKSGSQHSIFLCLRPSDETKNAEITLVNLARNLLDINTSNEYSFVENVNMMFDVAKNAAKSDACQSLVNIGYKIIAFVEFGDSIADASPYLKLAWCMTTAFLKIIATQPRTDKRVKDLVRNLMSLFSITKETSIFANPADSLRLAITDIIEFITQCNNLIHDYARRNFLARSIMQNKKAELEDLESRLEILKADLTAAFDRQGIIENRIEARVKISDKLREILEKKLQPKYESGRDRQRCLEGTRIQLLKEIDEWMQDTKAPNVFFLLGHAGTGKSTIATTVSEKYERLGQLGSRQYFTRGQSDPSLIFRTIAWGLAKQDQALAKVVKAQLDHNEVESATPDRFFEILLYEPLHAVLEKGKIQYNTLIVLDALDECGDRETRKPYIRLIKENLQTLPSNYRFLVTSRPEEDIGTPGSLERLGLRSRWLDHESMEAQGDVQRYIEYELGKLRDSGRIIVEPDWPWNENMRVLGESAKGLFIWAKTAVGLIESKRGNMGGELKRLVNSKSLSLGGLYAAVFETSLDWGKDMKNDFSKVFSLIILSKEQLSDMEIDNFLGLDYGKTRGILNSVHSLITYGSNQSVQLYHTSLYDYLTSEETRGNAWYIDEKIGKERISLRCLEVMEGLRFNICGLETSCKLNKDVTELKERVKDNISGSLRYSCRHWASHLRETSYSEELLSQVEVFTFNRLLYWIEVLSLTDSLYAFLSPSLEKAIMWTGGKNSQLSDFLQDAYSHLLVFLAPIAVCMPQIYMSFLPLMKEISIVAKHYTEQANSLTKIEYVGNKPRMVCVGQFYAGVGVSNISYSPNGERIVSGSGADISIWDALSGRLLLGPFHGHSSYVVSVAYSANGKYIASGSEDKTIRVWNALTGEGIHSPLVGHSDGVCSVAFSGDVKYIASSSIDGTVRLWSVDSGEPVGEPLKGHSGSVESVIFSPNGLHLASGSSDCTIIIWDVQSRKITFGPLKGHSGPVTSLSFSPDSKKIASGSWDRSILVWEVSSGRNLRMFSENSVVKVNMGAHEKLLVENNKYYRVGQVYSVAYSYDGEHILSGSSDQNMLRLPDNLVRMWNAEDSDVPPKKFEGHNSEVIAVAFAPDSKHFASRSIDGVIKIWDVKGEVSDFETNSEIDSQSREIEMIAISPKTGYFLVSGSRDGTVCVWNTESGDLIKGPLIGHSDWVRSVAFSSNEIHFASGSADRSVRIWNMIDDECITCIGHTDWVCSVAFSPDGAHLASGSYDNSVRAWDVRRGLLIAEPLTGHYNPILSITYSPDGKKIVSGSDDNTTCTWNASDGSLLSTSQGQSNLVSSISYTRDGLYTVSSSDDNTIRVWNTETGQTSYGPIIGHAGIGSTVRFSFDDNWVISGSQDKSVCIWNASTSDLFFQSRVSTYVTSIASFPMSDSKYIKFASSSNNGILHVWSVNAELEGIRWRLDDEGWLTGNNGDLLIWIPPYLRESLSIGSCIRALNTHFEAKLHLSVNQGDKWTSCFSYLLHTSQNAMH